MRLAIAAPALATLCFGHIDPVAWLVNLARATRQRAACCCCFLGARRSGGEPIPRH